MHQESKHISENKTLHISIVGLPSDYTYMLYNFVEWILLPLEHYILFTAVSGLGFPESSSESIRLPVQETYTRDWIGNGIGKIPGRNGTSIFAWKILLSKCLSKWVSKTGTH